MKGVVIAETVLVVENLNLYNNWQVIRMDYIYGIK